jgi:hypothetical protein
MARPAAGSRFVARRLADGGALTGSANLPDRLPGVGTGSFNYVQRAMDCITIPLAHGFAG